PPRRRAEIGGGLDQALIEPRQAAVKRQDHKRQVGVDEAQGHREAVVEERQRRIDQPEGEQYAVDQTARLQDRDPGINADQKARPERQHDEKQQQLPPYARRARNRKRDGIADQKAQQGRERGQAQRADIDAQAALRERAVIGQGPNQFERG